MRLREEMIIDFGGVCHMEIAREVFFVFSRLQHNFLLMIEMSYRF